MKLDIGTRHSRTAGFTAVDWTHGLDARALPYAPNSIEAILASHVLEHIPNSEVQPTLEHWVSLLKPGAFMRIAVPDFEKIVRLMAAGEPDKPYEAWIMGGQTDDQDFHRTIWTESKLREAMTAAGLVDIEEWIGTPGDCSSVEISCNLVGRKPTDAAVEVKPPDFPDMEFVMTMPRLAWTDNMLCLAKVGRELEMGCTKTSGVFYGQNMQRALEGLCANPKIKYAVCVDYDSLFDWQDLTRLRRIADEFELDAVAPIQSGRERSTPLFTIAAEGGGNRASLNPDAIKDPFIPCNSMHFGLTLIRMESLRKLPKPWLVSLPDPNGEWGEGRIDDDIHFWKQAVGAKWKFGIAPSVSIGHIETVAAWSGERLQTRYQPLYAYLRSGKPWYVKDRETWRYLPRQA